MEGKGSRQEMCCRGGCGVGWERVGRQREWVVVGALLALDTGKPMVIHCRGILNFIGNV